MKKEKGFLTVEAALIIPIVIFCITFILYLFFYQHDLIRIKGELDKVLFKTNMSTAYIKEETIERTVKQNLEKELYFARIYGIDIVKKFSTYSVIVEVQNEYPWFAGRKMFGINEVHTVIVTKGIKHKPNEFIVRVDVLMDLLSEVKGISKYIE